VAEEGISPEVKSFITQHIDSVVQLEILLLLHARREQAFNADEISRELRVDRAWVEGQLSNLCGRGLLNCSDQTPPLYQYAPRDNKLSAAVDALAREYAQRRVTVISLIFSKPVDKIQAFADAFRIRKDKTDG